MGGAIVIENRDKGRLMPGIPFQSKLEPFYDFIRECRMKRWTYARIAEALTLDHGIAVCPTTVFSFVRVRARKRKLYALPPRHDFGFAASDPATAQPASKELQRLATDFFISPNPDEPSNPETNRSKNEKRNYRIE